MSSKIRIKVGPIEVEFEGTESFLKNELLDLLQAVVDLRKKTDASAPEEEDSGDTNTNWTTETFASKLSCKSGSDLVVAACARLSLGLGRASFKRPAILDEIKTASSHYKKSYSSNLTKYLNGLVSNGRLNESATHTYALTQTEKTSLKKRLGL